jgi:acylphosphatase
MDMKRLHILITGMVQGVFFRAHMQRVARSLELTGWVKNLADGKVEATVEGSEINLASMLDWCREGSSGAVVTQVEVTDEPYTGDDTDFSVRH